MATSTAEGHGGGNVKLQSGTFTQNGGVIQNGTAAYGGNIDTRSKLYIKGLVKDGIATKNASNMLVASGTQTYIQSFFSASSPRVASIGAFAAAAIATMPIAFSVPLR